MIDHMAISNHGETIHGLGKWPRKGLLQKLGRKHADRVFCDGRDGKTYHVGYVVAGQWWRIYRVEPMRKEV